MTQTSITFLMYFSDVSEKHGPTHFVTREDSKKISRVSEKFLDGSSMTTLQKSLKPFEKTTAGPAGTIFAYGIDIFHRATNITKSGAYRYAVTSCFKKAGNDKLVYSLALSSTKAMANYFRECLPRAVKLLRCTCFETPWGPKYTSIGKFKISRMGYV